MSTWPVVTCTACGATGPGRRKAGLCQRCYARAQHEVRACAGCGQVRRHLAGGLCARCYRLSRTRLQHCPGCDEVRPVYFGDRCERCKRRAAAQAGRCRDCGRQVGRLWSGRCRTCDQRARDPVGDCADCGKRASLAGGRCKACRHFRWRHRLGRCPSCDRDLPIGAAGACRACQASRRAAARALEQERAAARAPAAVPVISPAGEQLIVALAGYGHARGWSPDTLRRARRGLVAVLTSGQALGQPPWDAAAVRRFLLGRHLIALRVVEFLADQGLVSCDGHAVLDRLLAPRLGLLPAPVAAEVRLWIEALRGRGPRPARPRDTTTIQGYLRALDTPLTAWSARYESLRQVTTEDLADQLTTLTGATRMLTMSAMRSLFKTLKTQRVLFTNPAAPLSGRAVQPPPVLALEPALRAGLLSRLGQPDQQLIVLLAGVHALLPSQICALTLDAADPAAGIVLTGGRHRHLDELTREHLLAWLQHRHARWPATANPHLLVSQATAGGLEPVSRSYVQNVASRAGVTAHALRADRILDEAHASGGDPLKLTRLFGISDPTAIRYCAELGLLDHEPAGDRASEGR